MNKRLKILCFGIIFAMMLQCANVNAKFELLPEEVYNMTKQVFTPLDISAAANMGFEDDTAGDGKGGWTDQGPTNDLSSFNLRGMNNLLGIDFNIIDPIKNNGKSCIVLRGQNNQAFPTSAEIPVNAKGAGVYFLHASAWLKGEVGKYRFVYEDGSEGVVAINANESIFDWWGKASTDISRVAWTGSNLSTSLIGINAFACANPYPDKLIKKIIAETKGDNSYLMIIAATLTDSGPYFPNQKDLGNPDTSNWYPYVPENNRISKGSALDVSFVLDAPAGKHGYVTRKGEDFVFEDGTPARFWAINVNQRYCFPQKDDADEFADVLSQKGFNLVRIHGYDWTKKGDGTGGIFEDDSSLSFDKATMNNLCYMLSKFKEKGIYYVLDLNIFRQAYENDNIIDYSQVRAGYDALAFFDERCIELQLIFAENLLTWYNPYTGMTIGEDPALALIDYNNENSLTSLRYELPAYYDAKLRELFSKWLKDKYISDEKLAEAWYQEGRKGLEQGESILKSSIKMPPTNLRSVYSIKRQADSHQFLAETQKKFYDRMTEKIRSLGVKAMLSGSTYWSPTGGDLALGWSMCHMDYLDVHDYYCHPTGGDYTLRPPGRVSDPVTSMIDKDDLGIFGYFMNRLVYGIPYTISEWNVLDPNQYVSESFLMMSAYASLQGWYPMLYSWGPTNFAERRSLAQKKQQCARRKRNLLFYGASGKGCLISGIIIDVCARRFKRSRSRLL